MSTDQNASLTEQAPPIPAPPSDEVIQGCIYMIRGHRVVIDNDLANIYEVTTKALNQAVRRNGNRFPDDFAFQLTAEEADGMRSQNVTASRRNVRYRPWAFTEHGVTMLASLLKSDRAIQMSIAIVRAFVRLWQLLASHAELAHRIDELEQRSAYHDGQLVLLFDIVHQFLTPDTSVPQQRRIGFLPVD